MSTNEFLHLLDTKISLSSKIKSQMAHSIELTLTLPLHSLSQPNSNSKLLLHQDVKRFNLGPLGADSCLESHRIREV